MVDLFQKLINFQVSIEKSSRKIWNCNQSWWLLKKNFLTVCQTTFYLSRQVFWEKRTHERNFSLRTGQKLFPMWSKKLRVLSKNFFSRIVKTTFYVTRGKIRSINSWKKLSYIFSHFAEKLFKIWGYFCWRLFLLRLFLMKRSPPKFALSFCCSKHLVLFGFCSKALIVVTDKFGWHTRFPFNFRWNRDTFHNLKCLGKKDYCCFFYAALHGHSRKSTKSFYLPKQLKMLTKKHSNSIVSQTNVSQSKASCLDLPLFYNKYCTNSKRRDLRRETT